MAFLIGIRQIIRIKRRTHCDWEPRYADQRKGLMMMTPSTSRPGVMSFGMDRAAAEGAGVGDDCAVPIGAALSRLDLRCTGQIESVISSTRKRVHIVIRPAAISWEGGSGRVGRVACT